MFKLVHSIFSMYVHIYIFLSLKSGNSFYENKDGIVSVCSFSTELVQIQLALEFILDILF